jgi:hypothetical protein
LIFDDKKYKISKKMYRLDDFMKVYKRDYLEE